MPIGIIINSLSIVLGGLCGAFAGDRLSDNYKDTLNMIFGLSAFGMGITNVVLMKNMPAVIFSVILGTSLGLLIHLGDNINRLVISLQDRFSGSSGNINELITVIVLFCASGTGIYGSLVSGMNGDHSILIAKSILDFFTAMIFACRLGKTVSFIAVPQFILFMSLFLLAGLIIPVTTETMINDFKAVGGFIMLASGFRMLKLKEFPTADMIPGMVVAMPISWLWVTYILPLVS
ncbi:MAG: DUF554 domain-containing protein [Solobacterium sp.]|nr:DUF554 domain-containing protein [Solobacterium sp.]MBR2668459.1 DUF554 domain-containing protein [Solobacterium sp.]